MDSDAIFKKYLGTWPDALIMWPEKGKDNLINFFWSNPDDPFEGKVVFDDFLDFVKQETNGDPAQFSCSEWLTKYYKTVRGRELAKKHLARHEPMLSIVSFNVPPLKDMMDGFIKYFIENRRLLL